MSRMPTLAPAAASARAVASPSPDAPPVTIAVCPLMFMPYSFAEVRAYIANRRCMQKS